MLKEIFDKMISIMLDYVAVKAAHAEKLDQIDKMLQYSEWKKDELRAEQREDFRARKERLIVSFTEQVNEVKRIMSEKQTALDMGNQKLANALLFITALAPESKPDISVMKKIADNFAGDTSSLNTLLCAAECRGVDKLYLKPIEELIYSEKEMDDLLDKFIQAVDGNLMIRTAAKEVMTAAQMCGVILTVPEIEDEVGDNNFIRKAFGLSVSAL
ncbi:MAG: hypothetical protein IJJ69_07715 [Oscillospiraceae bacterium]|nr:hypothetical protein [Oscillospiraceae bacterium]